MFQLIRQSRNSINPLGYGVIRGFNCTTSFKSGPRGKSSMSKDLFKLILWNETIINEGGRRKTHEETKNSLRSGK